MRVFPSSNLHLNSHGGLPMDVSENYKNHTLAEMQKRSFPAVRIVAIFLGFSICWLFGSDYIINAAFATSGQASENLETLKVLFYFMVTATFIFLGVSQFQKTIEKKEFQKLLYFDECLYPIFILDRKKLTILDANPAAIKLYGFAKRDLQNKSLQFFQIEPVLPLVNGKQEVNHRNRWNSSFKAVLYWQEMEMRGVDVYCLHVLNFVSFMPEGAVNLAWEAKEKFLLQKMARLEECTRRMALQIKITDETSAELRTQISSIDVARLATAESARSTTFEQTSDLTDLIESLDEIVWSYNVGEMRFEYLSSSLERVFEVTRDEFLAKPDCWEFFIHPSDKHVIPQRNQAVAASDKADFKFRIISASGTVKWLSEQLKIVRDARGNVITVKGVSSEITTRKENEETLQRRQAVLDGVFNNGQEDFLVLDTEGAIIIFNRRAERESAVFCAPPEYGQNFFKTFSGCHQLVAENCFRQALETKTPISEEIRCEIAVGETMWYSYSFVPVLNESGDVQTVCFRGRDITEARE